MEKGARVGIVGGGLAGLAAAVGLAAKGVQVELFEAKANLGGRAASVEDPESGEEVDSCLHFATGGCTNFIQFCAQIGAEKNIEHFSRLHLFGPDGKRSDLSAIAGVPAPLHLAASFLRLSFLSRNERWGIIKALRELAAPLSEEDAELSVLRWLRLHDQSPRAIEQFWAVMLVGSLGEKLENASLVAARTVMLDRFLRHRSGYVIHLPTKSIRQSIIEPAAKWLDTHGAKIHVATPVRLVLGSLDRCQGLLLKDGATRGFDVIIVAAAWRHLSNLLSEGLKPALDSWSTLDQWPTASMTGVHLWFDRPLTPLSHALLVKGLTQWVFRRHARAAADVQGTSGFYYQVILNPTQNLAGRSDREIIDEIQSDLAKIWPAGREAKVLRSRIVTDAHAAFSYGLHRDDSRPPQETIVPNLLFAGDWTKTGWPSTMEGAIRSGNLAGEAVLRYLGLPAKLMAADLPTEWLARRWLFST